MWNEFVARYHYLGYKTLVGAQMGCAAHDRNGWPLAMLGYSTAAWKLAPRDSFIGWTPQKRVKNLPLVVDYPERRWRGKARLSIVPPPPSSGPRPAYGPRVRRLDLFRVRRVRLKDCAHLPGTRARIVLACLGRGPEAVPRECALGRHASGPGMPAVPRPTAAMPAPGRPCPHVMAAYIFLHAALSFSPGRT